MTEPTIPPPPGDKKPPKPPPWSKYGAFVRAAGKAGRPDKLTEELLQDIMILITAGNYVETACAACGVAKATWYRWLKEGTVAKSGLKKRFRDAVMQAAAVSQSRDVLALDRAIGQGEWRAAAWRLERKSPAQWGRRDTVAVETSGVPAVVIDQRRQALLGVANDPAMRAMMSQLAAALMPAREQSEVDVIDGEIMMQDGA